jgi:hypothetical protein
MTILTKIILGAVGIWFTSLVLLFIFPTVLPVLSGFAILLSMPIALILLILTLATLVKSRRRVWPVLCFVLIIAVSYFALRQVTYWGALAHLYLNRRSYETTAARMLAARDEAERQRVCGERCWLLSDNPGRVAFHYVHSFLNWQDIVYDPSGEITAINTWDDRKKFNTYFIGAKRLTGDWYLAQFGD